MGFSLAPARIADDVQLHADGREKAVARLPSLPECFYGNAPERRVLFASLQEPA
jgi:hypothetical protein